MSSPYIIWSHVTVFLSLTSQTLKTSELYRSLHLKGLMKKEEITVFKYSLSHYNLELCQQVSLLQQNKMRIVLFEPTPISATALPAPSITRAPSLRPQPVALPASPAKPGHLQMELFYFAKQPSLEGIMVRLQSWVPGLEEILLCI